MYANLLALLMARLPQFENEEGQGMAEYGLILVLIALAAIGALGALGGGLGEKFEAIQTALGGVTTP